MKLIFSVYGGWDSRNVGFTGVCDCQRVYEFCNVINNLVCWWGLFIMFVYLILFDGV